MSTYAPPPIPLPFYWCQKGRHDCYYETVSPQMSSFVPRMQSRSRETGLLQKRALFFFLFSASAAEWWSHEQKERGLKRKKKCLKTVSDHSLFFLDAFLPRQGQWHHEHLPFVLLVLFWSCKGSIFSLWWPYCWQKTTNTSLLFHLVYVPQGLGDGLALKNTLSSMDKK